MSSASHPSLIPLLCPLEGQKESLYHLLQSLERKVGEKVEGSGQTASRIFPLKAASILKHLHGAASCSTEEERVAQYARDRKLGINKIDTFLSQEHSRFIQHC